MGDDLWGIDDVNQHLSIVFIVFYSFYSFL